LLGNRRGETCQGNFQRNLRKPGRGGRLRGYNGGMLSQVPERSLYQRIYDAIRQVPPGRVTTYGRVARLVGGISAQMVGFALAALPSRPDGGDVPWHRVINAQGRVSSHGLGFGTAIQRELLENEGIIFDVEGRIDLEQFGWY